MTLMTIGALARESGLTPSALRFYDDCGLLVPADVDTRTGYRYYSPGDLDRAVMIRRLREIGLPLDDVRACLAGEGRAVLEAHVRELDRRARAAAVIAASLISELAVGISKVVLAGSVFADAVSQVESARDRTGDIRVLTGILVDVGPAGVEFTATDRYRLATRTLVARDVVTNSWSAVVDGHELRSAAESVDHDGDVTVALSESGLTIESGRERRVCSVIDEQFPDHRVILSSLAPTVTRVVLRRDALLSALEVSDDAVLVQVRVGEVIIGDHRANATSTGPDIDLAFDPKVLRPAVATAVGPDLMLDVAAADQPIVVRSAEDGDLTTLVMPVAMEALAR